VRFNVPLDALSLGHFGDDCMHVSDETVRLRAVLESAQCNIYSSRQLFKLAQDAYKRAVPPLNSGAPRCRPLLDAALELGLQVHLHLRFSTLIWFLQACR